MIYVLIGKSASGKTTAREYFEANGFIGYEASSFINNAKTRTGIVNSEALLLKLGMDYVAKEISKSLHKDIDAVISGFRTVQELDCIKQIGSVKTIGIYSADELCLNRYNSRKRDNECLSPIDFYKKLCADYSLGLGKLLSEHVDHWVINDASTEALFTQLDPFIRGVIDE